MLELVGEEKYFLEMFLVLVGEQEYFLALFLVLVGKKDNKVTAEC